MNLVGVIVTLFILFPVITLARSWNLLEPTEEYPHEVLLADRCRLFWKFDEEDITFEVHVQTQGWVGFGISPNGGMTGADLVMGWFGTDGNDVFSDRHGVGNQSPVVDEDQNWHLLEMSHEEGILIMKLERPLDLCNDEDLPIQPGTMRVIWAFNNELPQDDLPRYHGSTNRGTHSLNLLSYDDGGPDLPDDVIEWSFTVDKLHLPPKDTLYWCHQAKLPDFNETLHMVRWAPVFTNATERLLHHIIVYRCNNAHTDDTDGLGHECWSANMPPHFWQCSSYMVSWAVGEEYVNLPEHVGFPLHPDTAPGYIMMEIHYDNPDMVEGLVDYSGIKLYLTKRLRDHETGIIGMGQLSTSIRNGFLVPPRSPNFVSYAHCTTECLGKSLEAANVEEIHIFAVFLHAHLLARRLRLHHFRNGKELPMIAIDHNYDFNYQYPQFLPMEVTILPGDKLEMICEYDSKDKAEITWGGLSTREEMCIAFVMYYPIIPMGGCYSYNTFAQNLKLIDAKWIPTILPPFYRVLEPKEYENQTFQEIFEQLDWSDPCLREKYQSLMGEQNTLTWRMCDPHSDFEVGFMNISTLTDPEMEFPVCGWRKDDGSDDQCPEQLIDSTQSQHPMPFLVSFVCFLIMLPMLA